MLATSNKWKETINSDDRICVGYITLNDVIIDDDIFKFTIKDTIYDESFNGTFVKKTCDLQILNKNKQYDFENKNIKVYIGLQYEDNTTEYLFLGTYMIFSAKYDDVNQMSELQAYDISSLFDIKFVDDKTFPCTLREYLTHICSKVGVQLSSKTFNLETTILTSQPYVGGESATYRDAVRQLAQTCISCAEIIDDKLEIVSINRSNKTADIILDDYFELTSENTVGPYNVIVLSRTPQEDNVVYPQPVPENPIEFRIENDYMVDKNRELFAPLMFTYVDGLTFTPCEIQLLKGRPDINCLDYVDYLDMNNITKQMIIFTHEFTFDGDFNSKISCSAKTENQTNYKRANTLDSRVTNTELEVDKQKGEIKAVVETVTGTYDVTDDTVYKQGKTYYVFIDDVYNVLEPGEDYQIGDEITGIVYEYNEGLERRVSAAEAKLTEQELTINIISTNINRTNGDVREVTTTNGFKFNSEGLNISSSEDEFNALHNTKGTYYRDGNTILSQFTKDNTIIKDLVLYGKYYYGVDPDLDVASFKKDDAMFIAELYTDNNNEEGFGHFYNGGE